MKKIDAPFFRRNSQRQATLSTKTSTLPQQHLYRWGILINLALVLLQLGAFWVLIDTQRTQNKALHAQQLALTDQVFARLDDKDADIIKIFIERPYLRAYFFEGTPPPTGTDKQSIKTRREIIALADLHLMFIEMFDNDYIRGLPKMEYGGEYDQLWKAYFLEMFQKSPALCERYLESQDQYSPSMCERYAKSTCNCQVAASK